MADEFLTSDELAGLLRTTRGTLHQWRTRGIGPRGVRIGRRVLYRRTDVDGWLAERAAEQRRPVVSR